MQSAPTSEGVRVFVSVLDMGLPYTHSSFDMSDGAGVLPLAALSGVGGVVCVEAVRCVCDVCSNHHSGVGRGARGM